MHAYANRRWCLAGDVVANPKETSFYQASLVAKKFGGGTLLVLDRRERPHKYRPATPFSRIWCAFEEHTSINEGLPLDIDAYHNEKAKLLAAGTVTQDAQHGGGFADKLKADREKTFPAEVLGDGDSGCPTQQCPIRRK